MSAKLLDDPQAEDSDLRLVVAVLYDHGAGVRAALGDGADLHVTDRSGRGVLEMALEAGAAEALAALLMAGADPARLPGAETLSPVALALRACHRRFDLASALLTAGVALQGDPERRGALADAVERNDPEAVRWVLDHGGWPYGQAGGVLIARARSRGLGEIADMLVLEEARRLRHRQGPPPEPDPHLLRPRHTAAEADPAGA